MRINDMVGNVGYIGTEFYRNIDGEDKRILINLIDKEQNRMIKKDSKNSDSYKYQRLYRLRNMISNWRV